MNRIYLLSFICVIFLAGCLNDTSAKQDLDYDQTKKMVVDILQTDEGKKVLQEIIADEKMKQHLIMESDVVKQSIQDTFKSEESAEMWKRLFEDPQFVESYQQSMGEEQKKLMKSLMNDAAFQKQMLELLQNPEMTKQTLTVLKSQQYREHLEETIEQTLDTPLFQSKIQHLLLKAADQKKKEAEKEKGDEKEAGKEENKEEESGDSKEDSGQ